MIRKKIMKTGSVLMCAVILAASLTGCGLEKKPLSAEDTLTKVLTEEVNLESLSQKASGQTGKDLKQETVYIFTDAEGTQNKLLVNEQLVNGSGKDKIEDHTRLANIMNLSGDEEKIQNGNDVTWNAGGNSITYQGESSEQIPVTMKITYSLDGNKMNAGEIAGKNGHLVMNFEYENHTRQQVEINGTSKEVCVPFTMLTGMILPSDVFSNVEISNGKITNVGGNLVAIGVTMPGLKESLDMKIGEEEMDLEIPESFTIEADVTDFRFDTIMSVATSNLLSDINLDDISTEKLTGKVDELEDASEKIMNGSGDLQDGTRKLADGTKELKDGVAELNDKIPALREGVNKLDSGAGELVSGSERLSSGAKELSDGAGQVSSGAATLSSGAKEISTGASSLSEGAGKVSTGAASVKDGAVSLKDGAGDLSKGAGTLSKGASELSAGASQVSQGADSVSEGASGVAAGAQTLKTGVESYTNGVDQAAAGAVTLDTQMGAYVASIQQFYNALAQSETPLDQSVAALLGGANSLNDGTKQLQSSLEAGMNTAAGQYAQAYTGFYQIAVAFTSISNGLDEASAAAALQASGISGDADVTNQNQMALATGFLLNNASAIAGNGLCGMDGLVSIVSGLSQAYQAYSLSAGTYQTLQAGGYFQGMESLAGGVAALSAKVGSFSNPVDGTICTSIAKLNSAAAQLQSEGTAKVSTGLSTLSGNSQSLRDGASKLADGSATLATGANTLKEGAANLAIGASGLATGASTLATGASDLFTGAKTLVKGANSLAKGAGDVATGANSLATGASGLATGAGTLADGAASVATGANTLSNGTDSLLAGMRTLKNGTSELFSGTGTLADGAKKLYDGTTALADGAIELNDGAITLKNGTIEFNEDGIKKLSELADQDANRLLETIKKLIDIGQKYQSFAGKSDDMEGNVMFLYKTEGISISE